MRLHQLRRRGLLTAARRPKVLLTPGRRPPFRARASGVSRWRRRLADDEFGLYRDFSARQGTVTSLGRNERVEDETSDRLARDVRRRQRRTRELGQPDVVEPR